MSRQTVFNKALSHLRAQGKKSIGHSGCSYRGDDGLKCAIGIFIADRAYRYEFEGQAVRNIMDVLPKSVTSAGESFLSDLQSHLHDDVAEHGFRKSLEVYAASFAATYGLKYSAPETTP